MKSVEDTMAVKFIIFTFAVLAVAIGLVPKDIEAPEGWANRFEDMELCLAKENVTEDDMRDFVIKGVSQDDNESLKMAVLCFLKRINFFDGVSWNLEVINESEQKNPKVLKLITDCLTKDDYTLQPQERAYRAQKCVLKEGGTTE